ncbi:aldehyde dehydrogenase family protein, partial [Bifidobacterium thermophilum]|nr:aldehyde dehydrogenase family protein [Bifidobacterium thermophilum]
IHPAEQVRAINWVEEAVEKGAEVITGGMIENGIFMPTILTNVDAAAKVSCQEVFAPIVIVNRISSIDDGITAINDSSYGLQAGIFTNDIKTAF